MADGNSHPIVAAEPAGLALLRRPFPPNQVSKLPKETKAQIDQRKADRSSAVNCKVCGGWHHKNAVHLDYVGHAALTDRLLDADPEWSWEPAALRDGLPAFDATGGLWIKLTVCGVTRLGYGHAAAKPQMDPGAREKEVIGDALRNAAMRFGAALDLWHKGDLHADDEAEPSAEPPAREPVDADDVRACFLEIDKADGPAALVAWGKANADRIGKLTERGQAAVRGHYTARLESLRPKQPAPAREADEVFA